MDHRIVPLFEEKFLILKFDGIYDFIGGVSTNIKDSIENSLKNTDLNFTLEMDRKIIHEKVYAVYYPRLTVESFNVMKVDDLVVLTKDEFYKLEDKFSSKILQEVKNGRFL